MRIAIDGLNIRKGGGETVMLRLVAALQAVGHDVVVFTGTRDVAERSSQAEGIVETNFVLVPQAASALGALLWRHRHWEGAVTKWGCTLSIGFNYWIPVKGPQATLHINVIPFLSLRERINAVGLVRALLQRFYGLRSLSRSNLNLFESEHLLVLANQATRKPIRNPRVAYVGVDVPERIPAVTPAQNYLVAVTSPAAHKQNHKLFELHRELATRHPSNPIGLQLIGVDDSLMDFSGALSTQKAYVDGATGIIFHGYVDRGRLYDLLAGAHALVSFSELESFYMVALEAMAVRCPVICADISSVRESVGEAGLLFPPGDVRAAAERVEDLSEAEVRERMIARGIDRARAFDANKCFEAIADTLSYKFDAI